MANNFSIKNDGSFMEQFLKLQGGSGAAEAANGSDEAGGAASGGVQHPTSDVQQMDPQYYGMDPQQYYQQYQQYYAAYGQQQSYPGAGYGQQYPGYPGYGGYPPQQGGGGHGPPHDTGMGMRSSGGLGRSSEGLMGSGGMGGMMGVLGGRPPLPSQQQAQQQQQQQQQQQGIPTRSVWLGNLPQDVSESEIRAKFAHHGLIDSVKMLTQKNCAFVNFADLDSAISAHGNSQGVSIRGQEVRIGWGKPETNDGGTGAQGRPAADRDIIAPSRNLWVGNLSAEVTEEILRQEFQTYGAIDRVRALPHKNCAFITFLSLEAAMTARNGLQGKLLGDRQIRVNFGRDGERDQDKRQEQRPQGGDFRAGLGYQGGSGGGGGGGHDSGGGGGVAPWLQQQTQESTSPPAQAVPPPKFTPPPPNQEEQKIIDKMAEFVSRNGPQFETMLKNKEKNNPKLQFLFLGDARYDYYRWKVYCLQNNIPSDGSSVPSSGSAHTAPPTSQPQPGDLSLRELDEFDQLIANLTGTRESITTSREWVLAHLHLITELVDRIVYSIQKAQDVDKRLHIIYLINDALLRSMKNRSESETLDEVSTSFLPKIPYIMQFGLEGQSEEKKEKIMKILTYWGEKSVYPESAIHRIERQLRNEEHLPPLPGSMPPKPASTSLPPWQQQQQQQPAYGGGAPPPWQQQQQQYPPPPQPSPHLQARLSDFYAEDATDRKRQRPSSPGEEVSKRRTTESKWDNNGSWNNSGTGPASDQTGGYRRGGY